MIEQAIVQDCPKLFNSSALVASYSKVSEALCWRNFIFTNKGELKLSRLIWKSKTTFLEEVFKKLSIIKFCEAHDKAILI